MRDGLLHLQTMDRAPAFSEINRGFIAKERDARREGKNSERASIMNKWQVFLKVQTFPS